MSLSLLIIKNLPTVFLLNFFLIGSIQSQTVDHPTIKQLEVSYKMPDFAEMDTIKMVRAQIIITLKNDTSVSVIHFKIMKESDQSIVYQSDYSVTDPANINSDGVLLFKKEGTTIYIKSPSLIPLKLYQYQITTENSQGILSELFTELH